MEIMTQPNKTKHFKTQQKLFVCFLSFLYHQICHCLAFLPDLERNIWHWLHDIIIVFSLFISSLQLLSVHERHFNGPQLKLDQFCFLFNCWFYMYILTLLKFTGLPIIFIIFLWGWSFLLDYHSFDFFYPQNLSKSKDIDFFFLTFQKVFYS